MEINSTQQRIPKMQTDRYLMSRKFEKLLEERGVELAVETAKLS